MLERICAHQPELLDRAASGRELDAALAEHLAACPSCREAVEAIQWMRRLADTPATTEAHALPNADVIWWKAQLLRRWEVERRVTAPIERMHKAELVAGLASLAGFVVWQWTGFIRIFSNVIPATLANWSVKAASGTTSAADTSSLGLALGSVLLGAMILALFHRMLSDH